MQCFVIHIVLLETSREVVFNENIAFLDKLVQNLDAGLVSEREANRLLIAVHLLRVNLGPSGLIMGKCVVQLSSKRSRQGPVATRPGISQMADPRLEYHHHAQGVRF